MHVIAPRKNAQLQLPSDTMTNACTTLKIKSRLHPPIKARQTQFPTSHRTALPCERPGSVSSRKHHPLFPASSQRPLSTGAYLHRDGKGTEERKSILYLTAKHNSNQKQLEFAGCSINWTASSGWTPCRWIDTVMHYSTMAQAWVCQTQWHTYIHVHKHRVEQHAPRSWGLAGAMRKTLRRHGQS